MASTSRMNSRLHNPAEILKAILADNSDSNSDGQDGDSEVEESQSDVEEIQSDVEESQSDVEESQSDVEENQSDVEESQCDEDESESENVNDDSSNGSSDKSSDSETTDEPTFFIGGSGRQWSSNPPPVSRTRGPNVFTKREGPRGAARNVPDPHEAFSTFIPNSLLEDVVKYSNEYAHHYMRTNDKDPSSWQTLTLAELKAVIGLLFLAGVGKGQHESIRSLWSDGPLGRPV